MIYTTLPSEAWVRGDAGPSAFQLELDKFATGRQESGEYRNGGLNWAGENLERLQREKIQILECVWDRILEKLG